MNKNVLELIENYRWPGISSITFDDGKMTLLDLEFYSKGKYYIGPIADTTIDSYLKYNGDDLSYFDVFSKDKNEHHQVFAGDGSGEGDGVIYLLNVQTDSLVWFAFFENSEPFKKVKLNNEGVVSATSALGIEWNISILNPLKIVLRYPDELIKNRVST